MAETLNCRCCGAALETYSNLVVCKHCLATNFISDVANKNIIQLNRANKLRQESEFDNAARIYDNILEENEPTADILWYRTLCEYGIEYVPDPVSDKYFPTLHRINDESILDCDFFKQAYELADGEQKETLIKEAEYINEVQTKYLNIAANEAPYDVFICYKETDLDSGEKTEDVSLAEELYYELTGRGYKVFFARETLKEKLSVEYEPYIFAALKSAKAMAVIGTKAEYFTSVWVKNEWGRFLKLMDKNPDKQMFFACDDPEEMPRAFAYKQAQILGEDGAIRNLAANIDNFLKNNKQIETNLPNEELYQKEFDEILEAKTREYVKDFRFSELGRKRKEILDNIDKNIVELDEYIKKDGQIFAVGTIIYLGSFLFMLFLYIFLFRFDIDYQERCILTTAIPLPFMIAGAAIMLSYNWKFDIITVSAMIVILLISTFVPIHAFGFLPFLAVYAPIAVYILTGQIFEKYNRFKSGRNKVSLKIKKELEELKEISNQAGRELKSAASKLLKEYKEKNNISFFIQLQDDDYLKAFDNFNYMYESSAKKYMKYVDVSDPKARRSPDKEESRFGSAVFASLMIVPLTAISFIAAILDIVHDKYKEYRHKHSDWTLALFIVFVVGAIVGFICVYRW